MAMRRGVTAGAWLQVCSAWARWHDGLLALDQSSGALRPSLAADQGWPPLWCPPLQYAAYVADRLLTAFGEAPLKRAHNPFGWRVGPGRPDPWGSACWSSIISIASIACITSIAMRTAACAPCASCVSLEDVHKGDSNRFACAMRLTLPALPSSFAASAGGRERQARRAPWPSALHPLNHKRLHSTAPCLPLQAGGGRHAGPRDQARGRGLAGAGRHQQGAGEAPGGRRQSRQLGTPSGHAAHSTSRAMVGGCMAAEPEGWRARA